MIFFGGLLVVVLLTLTIAIVFLRWRIDELENKAESAPTYDSIRETAYHAVMRYVQERKLKGGTVQEYLAIPLVVTEHLYYGGKPFVSVEAPDAKRVSRYGEVSYNTTLGELLGKLLRAHKVTVTPSSEGSLKVEPPAPRFVTIDPSDGVYRVKEVSGFDNSEEQDG
jgi:hypothetical protein